MARAAGWTRVGSKRRFRYLDANGEEIVDEERLERIRDLAIPPAWRDVWICRNPRGKLQATGVDAAGRTQYLYHPAYRARQEAAKFERLIRFAEGLPALRAAMAEDVERAGLPYERVAALAVRLINLGWFRVGSERYARTSRTYGITTLHKRHVRVRGARVTFRYRGKQRIMVRSALVDPDLAAAVRELLALPGSRLFRYECDDDDVANLDARRLNDYIRMHLGDEFSAKDFRTWGGTLIAAIQFAEGEPATSPTQAKRRVAAVMRTVADQLGNTPAVARASYVSPAVVEQYLDGRTIADFRPRNLRVIGARDLGLDAEEQATLSLLRSWRIRSARAAA